MSNHQEITNFPSEVIEEIGYYVYRLLDPRTGETFYVGKGKGNRVFNHAKLARDKLALDTQEDETPEDLKIATIQNIINAGLEPTIIIHRHGMDEATAFHVEDALMDVYPALTNKVTGHGNSEIGMMHVKDLIAKYKAEEAVFTNKVILININQSIAEEKSIYDAVRFAWKINIARAQQADYILAISKGIIKGLFQATEWKPATQENFPEFGQTLEKRSGFIGIEAPKDIQQHYVGKRIPESYRKKGAMAPVKYSY